MHGVGLRDEHAQRAALQGADDLGQALRQGRRHAFERLVEQEQPRAHGQRARQCHELLLPARQEQGAALAHLGDFGQQAIGQGQPLGTIELRVDPQRQQHVLFDGELRHEAAVLGHVADAQAGTRVAWQLSQVDIAEAQRACRGRQMAHHGAHEARLAGAVAPHQADHLAFVDGQAEVAQRRHGLDVRGQVRDVQQRHGACLMGASCASLHGATRACPVT